MRTKVLISILVLACIILSGCKGKTPEEQARQTVKQFINAYKDYDKDKMLSVISGSEGVKKFVSGMFDYYAATAQFKESVIAEYGQEGWENLVGREGAFLNMNSPADEIDLDDLHIEIQGDTATCTTPSQDGPLDLIKQKGKWYVDMGEMTGDANSEEDINNMVKMFSAMKNAIEQVKQKIGQPGVTPESLGEDLEQAMMQASMNAMRENN